MNYTPDDRADLLDYIIDRWIKEDPEQLKQVIHDVERTLKNNTKEIAALKNKIKELEDTK